MERTYSPAGAPLWSPLKLSFNKGFHTGPAVRTKGRRATESQGAPQLTIRIVQIVCLASEISKSCPLRSDEAAAAWSGLRNHSCVFTAQETAVPSCDLSLPRTIFPTHPHAHTKWLLPISNLKSVASSTDAPSEGDRCCSAIKGHPGPGLYKRPAWLRCAAATGPGHTCQRDINTSS